MNEEQLKAILAVTEHGSITKAAPELNLTVQGAKNYIDSIEREMGCKLFVRSNRGVTLTPEGQEYVRRAPRLIASMEEFRTAVLEQGGGRQELRVAVWHDRSNPGQDELLERFACQNPQTKIIFVEVSDNGVYADIANNRSDIGFTLGGLRDAEEHHNIEETICPGLFMSYACALEAAHPLLAHHPKSIKPADLAIYDARVAGPAVPEELAAFGVRRTVGVERSAMINLCHAGGIYIDDSRLIQNYPGILMAPLDLDPVPILLVHRHNPDYAVKRFIELMKDAQ